MAVLLQLAGVSGTVGEHVGWMKGRTSGENRLVKNTKLSGILINVRGLRTTRECGCNLQSLVLCIPVCINMVARIHM